MVMRPGIPPEAVHGQPIGALIGKMYQLTEAPTVDLTQDPRVLKTKFPLDKL